MTSPLSTSICSCKSAYCAEHTRKQKDNDSEFLPLKGLNISDEISTSAPQSPSSFPKHQFRPLSSPPISIQLSPRGQFLINRERALSSAKVDPDSDDEVGVLEDFSLESNTESIGPRSRANSESDVKDTDDTAFKKNAEITQQPAEGDLEANFMFDEYS